MAGKLATPRPSRSSSPTKTQSKKSPVAATSPGPAPSSSPSQPMKSKDKKKLELKGGTVPNVGIVSPEILAMAELLATMKHTISTLHSTFESLGDQTEKIASLGPAINASEQIAQLRVALGKQIETQETALKDVRLKLRNAIEQALADDLRTKVNTSIQGLVAKEVKERVRQQLSERIPENLRQQVQGHTRQLLEVQTNLRNTEARRYNASLGSASWNQYLRPLLRPLPTPEQSPNIVISGAFLLGHSTNPSPVSARPKAPAPTPTHTSSLLTPGGINLVPPTPSPLFPRDLKALFSLSPDTAKKLLADYGLDDSASDPSPVSPSNTEKASPSSSKASKKTPASATGSDKTLVGDNNNKGTTGEADLNKFMLHIGVPFVMVPAPKPKGNTDVASSSSSRGDRRLLTRLIINTSPISP